MEISPGDTFLYQAQENKKHLHIVVSIIKGDVAVCAFVSSVKTGKGYDKSCVLTENDSPFLDRDSYVVYDKIRLYKIRAIQDMIECSKAIYKGKVDAPVLERIIKGAINSKMTNNKMRQYIIDAATRN